MVEDPRKATTFRLGELFSGPGGLALGAKLANASDDSGKMFTISHQWATDYDLDTCRTYAENLTSGDLRSVIHKDIRELDLDRVKAELGEIDGLAFGFPCNDFSVVGSQQGLDGSFGPLYSYGVKALEVFQPLWFLAENVSGLQSANEGLAFQKILEDLSSSGQGYNLVTNEYRFEEYGVPQARHRLIIVGIRSDIDVKFSVPKPTHFPSNYVTAQEALANIPAWATGQERTRHHPRVIRRLQSIPEGGNAWTAEEDTPPEVRLRVQGARLSQIYRRLYRDRPAYTVTGSGGGGTHIYHWQEDRALTNRERARLQTFPDDFNFVGGTQSVRKQIGMAVPPQGAKVIFEAILKSFAGISYPSVPPSYNDQLALKIPHT